MKCRDKAFTLLEVTLATALFAAAVVVLTSAFANALAAMHTMRADADDEPMFRYIRSLVITVPDRQNFEEGEDLDMPDVATASWTATTEQTRIADLFKVVLTINLTKRNEKTPITRTETLYLYRPTWSDTDDRDKLISDAKTELTTERRTVQ
jgi:hypothetical protein